MTMEAQLYGGQGTLILRVTKARSLHFTVHAGAKCAAFLQISFVPISVKLMQAYITLPYPCQCVGLRSLICVPSEQKLR